MSHRDDDLSPGVEELRRHTDRGLDPGRAGVVYQRIQGTIDAPRRRWWAVAAAAGLVGATMALAVLCSPEPPGPTPPATPMRLTVH